MTTFLIATVLLTVCAAAVLAQSLKARVANSERCRCPVCDSRRS